MGMRVIVAGEAWVRNKGVTLDANSASEYFEILNRLPLKGSLDKNTTERARQYAYHLFFRRMIPLPFTSPSPGSLSTPDIGIIDDLLPARHSGLDVICNGILSGSEFVYPAELYPMIPEGNTPVTKESRARGSLRVVEMLGKLGEVERTRAHLLKTLREFPWLTTESWAQYSIARNVSKLALASDKPASAVACFCHELKTIAGQSGFWNRLRLRRAIARILTEISISFWKTGSRSLAVAAAGHSLYNDPSQLVRGALLTRFLRSFFLGSRIDGADRHKTSSGSV